MNLYELDYEAAEAALQGMTKEELIEQALVMRAGMRLTERAFDGFRALVRDLIYSAMHTSDEEAKARHLDAALAALTPGEEQR